MIAIVLAMLKMLPVGDQDVSKGGGGQKSVREIALMPRGIQEQAKGVQAEGIKRKRSGRLCGGLMPDRG